MTFDGSPLDSRVLFVHDASIFELEIKVQSKVTSYLSFWVWDVQTLSLTLVSFASVALLSMKQVAFAASALLMVYQTADGENRSLPLPHRSEVRLQKAFSVLSQCVRY